MFPFGFESHLSFYLVVYVLTLVVHVLLMAYVLAGSLWLSWVTLFPGNDSIPRTKQPLSRILRDWMPFALSGAITAGVALLREPAPWLAMDGCDSGTGDCVLPSVCCEEQSGQSNVAAGPTGTVDQCCGLFPVRRILLDCQPSAQS
jgi:hypothetical protein